MRSVLEDLLLDIMYEIPSKDTICKVVIDEDFVNGKSTSPYTYKKVEEIKKPKKKTAKRA